MGAFADPDLWPTEPKIGAHPFRVHVMRRLCGLDDVELREKAAIVLGRIPGEQVSANALVRTVVASPALTPAEERGIARTLLHAFQECLAA